MGEITRSARFIGPLRRSTSHYDRQNSLRTSEAGPIKRARRGAMHHHDMRGVTFMCKVCEFLCCLVMRFRDIVADLHCLIV